MKSWPIEIERSQIAQNSPIKMSVFERFFEKSTKTSAKAKKCIFLSIFCKADKNPWILVKLPNFSKFYSQSRYFSIVSAKCAQSGFFIKSSFSAPKQPEMPEKSRWFAAAKSRGFFSYKALRGRKSSDI